MEKELEHTLHRLGYLYDISQQEHPACWGKSCEGQHLRSELKIWKPAKPRIFWSFASESNGSFDYVLERLPTLTPPV